MPYSPAAINLFILIAALVVISVGLYLGKRKDDARPQKASNAILIALGIIALLSYVNFKPFSTQPNNWDIFHYYIGSKYFPEIGYTRLYACVARAEAESDDPSVTHAAKRRTLRDLETNELVPARNYFFDENYCKERFSALRWESFKKDVEYFRNSLKSLWDLAQLDHGFNPSPVWILPGGLASNLIPLSDAAIAGLVLIDVILLAACVICLAWAFGLPAAAFAVIASLASGGIDWAWVGGGMLRLDWLFMAVLSICLMKREHYLLAGVALGYAAAVRVFPAIFALGPFIGLAYALYKRRREQKIAYLKFFGGMAVSAAALMIAVAIVYGTDSLRKFADNTRKHSAVVSTNNVGLRTVLTYSPETAVKKTIDTRAQEAHLYWKWEAAKTEAKQKIVPLYVAIVAACLLLYIPSVISSSPWQALALGATFIPFAWSEMSNYYYMFLMMVATLFATRQKIAFPLLGIGIATWVGKLYEIDVNKYFEPAAALTPPSGLGMDEVYTLFSAAVCISFIIIWWQINSQAMPWKKIMAKH